MKIAIEINDDSGLSQVKKPKALNVTVLTKGRKLNADQTSELYRIVTRLEQLFKKVGKQEISTAKNPNASGVSPCDPSELSLREVDEWCDQAMTRVIARQKAQSKSAEGRD